jgi:hypothetical protein
MLNPMHAVPPIFPFNVNNTQVISGQFNTVTGKTVSVDWGDGSARETYSGIDQPWSHDYGGAVDKTVRIFGAVTLTKFTTLVAGIDISFDLADFPASMLLFAATGNNTITGDLTDLPVYLTYFACHGNNTVTGDIANLPTSLTTFNCCGSNTVYGDLANLPQSLGYFVCTGSNTISDYTGKTWTTKPTRFEFLPTGVGGLSTAEVDQLLIDFDDDLVWAGGDVVCITGTNAARSAASDAAVANMIAEGAAVSTN